MDGFFFLPISGRCRWLQAHVWLFCLFLDSGMPQGNHQKDSIHEVALKRLALTPHKVHLMFSDKFTLGSESHQSKAFDQALTVILILG